MDESQESVNEKKIRSSVGAIAGQLWAFAMNRVLHEARVLEDQAPKKPKDPSLGGRSAKMQERFEKWNAEKEAKLEKLRRELLEDGYHRFHRLMDELGVAK